MALSLGIPSVDASSEASSTERLAVLATAESQVPRASKSPRPSSAQKAVRAELRAQCERILASDDPFFGDRNLERLEARIQRPSSDPRTRIEELGRYAFELLRVGRLEDSIARGEQALASLSSLPEEEGKSAGLERYLRALLGVAHFQLGEDENCLALGTEASCILPIRRGGLHTRTEHSRIAGDLFLQLLQEAPEDLASRWMLNLSRMLSGDYPDGVPETLRIPPHVLAPDYDRDRTPPYLNVAERLGVDARDLAGGAIMDDFDGDGRLDLVSSSSHPCQPLQVFRNTGTGFEDLAAEWQLDAQLGGLNLMQADYDNDGDLDLLVLRGAWSGENGRVRNSLLRNDLDSELDSELDPEAQVFVDVTAKAGLAYPAYPTQVGAWTDFDLDGDLDLFVGNEGPGASADPMAVAHNRSADYPSQLFRNNGNGTFSDTARAARIVERTFVKGAAWGDVDNDGDPDLYVSNLGANLFYRNLGDGTFAEEAEALGIDGGEGRTFATWFFDYDNDGDLDLFAAGYNLPADLAVATSYLGLATPTTGPFAGATSRPLLFRNQLETGELNFVEVGLESGFDKSLLPMGANYGDLDGDGRLDLYLGTGTPDFTALMPNVYYRNTERGFVDLTFESGLGHLQKGHGVAFGDLDNDGRLDLFQQLGGAFPYDAYGNALYLSPESSHRFLVLRLRGTTSNRFGIGARVEVQYRAGDERRTIHRVVGSGGSFGGSSLQLEIGLGNADRIEAVLVRWPGPKPAQPVRGIALDRRYDVIEGDPVARELSSPASQLDLAPRSHRHDAPPVPIGLP